MRALHEDTPVAVLVLHRLRWALLASALILLLGTIGYIALEGYGWVDGLYMSVITLGTIGYGEVHPLGTGGRIFTILVIAAGFTTLVYAVSVLTNLFVSGEALSQLQQRKAKRMRDLLSEHVIVVGFGRVGHAVVHGLQGLEKRCLVVERDPKHEEDARAFGVATVLGDATDQTDLHRAGIDRATALVATCASDSENLVVVLTARSLRPDLYIVSRVNEATWHERIVQAGADVAQSPYQLYGASLAAAAASAVVLDLHSLPLLGLGTEEIRVLDGSPLLGFTPDRIRESHPLVHLIGLRREGTLRLWHTIDDTVHVGDILVVLGPPDHLMTMAHDAAPAARSGGTSNNDRAAL